MSAELPACANIAAMLLEAQNTGISGSNWLPQLLI